ncbi:MAG: hypothetical protein RIC55_29530 [Pirellulaceae bacterium]
MTQLDDYRWLVSDDAARWLRECGEQVADAKLVVRLRGELGAQRASLVVTQAELRRRARGKFARAESMFFTVKGLMQSSGDDVAACKASRFPRQAATLDLCCGVGGDLMALAARGETRGVERDACLAVLAEANASLASQGRTLVATDDATACDVGAVSAWHIDPDRRTTGRRTTRLEHYAPDLASLERMLAANNSAAVKLAPATDVPDRWRREAERQWIGAGGECKQQVAWFGDLARHAGRATAVIVDNQGAVTSTVVGEGDSPNAESIPVAARVGRYVFEPHAAVLAAGLATTLARQYGLAPLTAGGAYLTGETQCNSSVLEDAALSAFEVRDVLPLDVKKLHRYLRAAGIGRLEIKKRGVDIDPGKLQRRLQGPGDAQATLLIGRLGDAVRVIVAHRQREGGASQKVKVKR